MKHVSRVVWARMKSRSAAHLTGTLWHSGSHCTSRTDVIDRPALPQQPQVLGLPTMKVVRGGEVVKTILGAKPAGALRCELAEHL